MLPRNSTMKLRMILNSFWPQLQMCSTTNCELPFFLNDVLFSGNTHLSYIGKLVICNTYSGMSARTHTHIFRGWMAQPLKVLTVLPEDLSSFPASILCSSELPVASAPRDLMSSFWSLCSPYEQTYTHTHKFSFQVSDLYDLSIHR